MHFVVVNDVTAGGAGHSRISYLIETIPQAADAMLIASGVEGGRRRGRRRGEEREEQRRGRRRGEGRQKLLAL